MKQFMNILEVVCLCIVLLTCVYNVYANQKVRSEETTEFENITGFSATDTGLQLYFSDGTGYYWESK